MSTKKPKKLDFAASLKELESIVNSIEQGGLNLEEALKLFERGVVLTKKCQQAIKAAEQKVQILTGEKLSDFACASESEDKGVDEGD